MPVAKKMEGGLLADEGRHILRLVEVIEDRVASRFSNDKDGKSPVWYWCFVSRTHKNADGTQQTVRHMTDAVLTPNNSQGKFWRKLLPGVSFEELSGDTADVEGCDFEAEIVHEEKNDKTYANIAFIKPYIAKSKPASRPAPKPAPAEPEDDGEELAPVEGDPFKEQ